MHYPELATVQVRLTYRLTSFLLENLDLPQRWSSVMRAGELAGYRALLTGLAKAFRSSHESARAVSCS